MAKSRRRRRVIRRALRMAVLVVLLVSVLPGIALTVSSSGDPLTRLLILPATMVGALVAAPIVLMALVVAVLAVALPFAILTAIFGSPLYVMYRLTAGGRRGRRGAVDDEEDERDKVTLPADVVLRRRYVAGELTYEQFQSGMIGLLRERFVRGELPMPAYEAELERLMAPVRRMDVRGDPAVAAARRTD